MITTRRSNLGSNETFYEKENGNVALLERESIKNDVKTDGYDEAKNKERMQRNLYNLLNYDRFSENLMEEEVVEEVSSSEVVDEAVSSNDEDIRPSSTTMQFGDIDAQTMLNEMPKEEKESTYKLNKKGKIVIALYTVCIAVIMALIVVNASVIAMLSKKETALTEELNQVMAEYNEAKLSAEEAMSEETIRDLAENVYNMVK